MLLFEETFTAVGDGFGGAWATLAYPEFINFPEIEVEFGGERYTLPNQEEEGSTANYGDSYGEAVLPLNIISSCGSSLDDEEVFRFLNTLYCQEVGEYTLKVWAEPVTGVLFDETVTTVMEDGMPAPFANLTYSQYMTYPEAEIEFDGVKYTVERQMFYCDIFYGANVYESGDFADYPFAILSDGAYNTFVTKEPGKHTIKFVVPGAEPEPEDESCQYTIPVITIPEEENPLLAYLGYEEKEVEIDGETMTILVKKSAPSGEAVVGSAIVGEARV